MFGGIVRLVGGGLGVGDNVRFFEHQVNDPVSRCPNTGQDCEPPDDEHVRRYSKMHTREYSGMRTTVKLDNEDIYAFPFSEEFACDPLKSTSEMVVFVMRRRYLFK